MDVDEWAFDKVPEIMDGMNVADFVDQDIDAKLRDLEKEEEEILREMCIRDEMHGGNESQSMGDIPGFNKALTLEDAESEKE